MNQLKQYSDMHANRGLTISMIQKYSIESYLHRLGVSMRWCLLTYHGHWIFSR